MCRASSPTPVLILEFGGATVYFDVFAHGAYLGGGRRYAWFPEGYSAFSRRYKEDAATGRTKSWVREKLCSPKESKDSLNDRSASPVTSKVDGPFLLPGQLEEPGFLVE